jgi:hypothetical protein
MFLLFDRLSVIGWAFSSVAYTKPNAFQQIEKAIHSAVFSIAYYVVLNHDRRQAYPFSDDSPTICLFLSNRDNFLIIFGSSGRELGGVLFARGFGPHGRTSNQEDKENG